MLNKSDIEIAMWLPPKFSLYFILVVNSFAHAGTTMTYTQTTDQLFLPVSKYIEKMTEKSSVFSF